MSIILVVVEWRGYPTTASSLRSSMQIDDDVNDDVNDDDDDVIFCAPKK